MVFQYLTIWEGKVEKYWKHKTFDLKAKSWRFFSKVKNRCLDIQKWKIVIMRWKPMPWRYFQYVIMISFKNCVENFLTSTFVDIYEKSRNLLRDFEPQNMIFFKKLISMSKRLKNSFRKIKYTSYQYSTSEEVLIMI